MDDQETTDTTQEQTQTQNTQKQPQQTADGNADNVKAVSAIAYLGILFFVPLLTNPESDFAKYHANQGLLLLLTFLVINTVGWVIPVIGWLIILPIGNIALLVLFIMGLINALNGEKKPLPVIGGFELIK